MRLFKEGCRDPLVIWNGLLIDGHNRYEICEKHDIEYNVIEVKQRLNRDQVKEWIGLNQLARRNLTPYQKAEVGFIFLPIEKKKAEKRRSATLKKGAEVPDSPDLDEREKGKAAEIVAERVGLKSSLFYMALFIHETAKNAEGDIKENITKDIIKLRKAEATIDNIYMKYKRQKRLEDFHAKPVAPFNVRLCPAI